MSSLLPVKAKAKVEDQLIFVLASYLANGSGEDRMLSRIMLRMLSFRPSVSELTPDRNPADQSHVFAKVSQNTFSAED